MRTDLAAGYAGYLSSNRRRETTNRASAPSEQASLRRRRAAIHESGHFVDSVLRGGNPQWLRVHPAGGGGTATDMYISDEDDIAVRYAGAAAEKVLIGDINEAGAASDIEDAEKTARRIWGSKVDEHLPRVMDAVVRNVRQHRLAIYTLATELERERHLSGAKARAIVKRYIAV